MTKLESTKAINQIKIIAIKEGGYDKNKVVILLACEMHLEEFGEDLRPKQLLNT
jgi:hypothetical protein